MRTALQEIARWDSTLLMTYREFGRRPKENQSGGTDHGTANLDCPFERMLLPAAYRRAAAGCKWPRRLLMLRA